MHVVTMHVLFQVILDCEEEDKRNPAFEECINNHEHNRMTPEEQNTLPFELCKNMSSFVSEICVGDLDILQNAAGRNDIQNLLDNISKFKADHKDFKSLLLEHEKKQTEAAEQIARLQSKVRELESVAKDGMMEIRKLHEILEKERQRHGEELKQERQRLDDQSVRLRELEAYVKGTLSKQVEKSAMDAAGNKVAATQLREQVSQGVQTQQQTQEQHHQQPPQQTPGKDTLFWEPTKPLGFIASDEFPFPTKEQKSGECLF